MGYCWDIVPNLPNHIRSLFWYPTIGSGGDGDGSSAQYLHFQHHLVGLRHGSGIHAGYAGDAKLILKIHMVIHYS